MGNHLHMAIRRRLLRDRYDMHSMKVGLCGLAAEAPAQVSRR
jgi:hypothetical protein